MLDFILKSTPSSRLTIIFVLLAGVTMYFRKQLADVPRPNFNNAQFVEDSRNGTGTRYTVITRGNATGGSSAELELLIRPTAVGFFPGFPGSTPYHSHPQQEEALKVVQGVMNYTINGKMGTAVAGEVLVLPAGTPHSVWFGGQPTDPPLVTRVTFSPANLGERFFENLAGLGHTYGDVSQIHPLQLALLFQHAGVHVEGIPAVFGWALEHVLPSIARILGFQPLYQEYESAEGSISGLPSQAE